MWTKEQTEKRRKEWNELMIEHKAANKMITPKKLQDIEIKMGYTLPELKSNIACHNQTPADKSRQEVSRLFGRAESCRDNPGDYFRKLGEAEKALKTWKETYPTEAQKEDMERNQEKEASKLRRKEELEQSFLGRDID